MRKVGVCVIVINIVGVALGVISICGLLQVWPCQSTVSKAD